MNGSKGFKYHSKSPEEWKKYDEEKERKYKEYRRARRKSLTILTINLFIIILVAFGFYFFRRISPPTNEFTHFSDGLIIQIKMKNDELFPAEKIDAEVDVLNSLKKKRKFHIEDFEFKVIDPNGEIIYSFSHPDEVEAEIDPYGSILVFDLSREETVTPMKPGVYTIIARMIFNGKSVILKRKIKVKESFEVKLSFEKDFYFPGEILNLKVEIFNGSAKDRRIHIRDANLKINDVEYKLTPLEKDVEIQAGGTKLVKFSEKPSVPRKMGKNSLNLRMSFVVDGRIKTVSRSSCFYVVNEDEIGDIADLRIMTDSMIYVQVGSPFGFSVYLVNDSNEDKFVMVERFEMRINGDKEKEEEFNWVGERRAYVPANSKRIVFKTDDWKTLQFNKTGDHRVIIRMILKGGELSHEFIIKAVSP